MLRKSRKQLTTRFLHRTVLFFVSFSFGLVLFFMFGNTQHFMDSTQSLILLIVSFTSLMTVILSGIFLVMEMILIFTKKKKKNVSMLVVNMFCLVTGILLSLLTHIIILLSHGL